MSDEVTITIDQDGNVAISPALLSAVNARLAIDRRIEDLRSRLAALEAARKALSEVIEVRSNRP